MRLPACQCSCVHIHLLVYVEVSTLLRRPRMTDKFLILHPAPEQVPGFVAFITAADIPDGGDREVFGDALFATDFAAYAGQRIGLAVAHSQVSNLRSPHQPLLVCCSGTCKQAASA